MASLIGTLHFVGWLGALGSHGVERCDSRVAAAFHQQLFWGALGCVWGESSVTGERAN